MKKEVREGYKITELGEIPNEWDIVALGEIGEFKNGINKSKEDFGFGCKFVNIQDAYYGNIVKNDLLERINVNDKEKEIYKLENDDIILVRSSVKPEGVGYPILFKKENEDIVYCGFMIRYRYDKRKINPIFLLYQLRSENIRKRVLDLSTVSANTNINQDSYKQIKISIPSIKEQEKIAEILSTVDEQIENTEKLIQKNQELKRGLMQQLLTKGIGHTEFKETELGYIPKCWDIKRLGECADIVSGATPKTNIKEYWDNGNIHWATPTDITSSGKYINKTEKFITDSGLKNCSAKILPIGSILMSSRATIGERSLNTVPMATNQGFKSLICKSIVDNEFIYYYIEVLKERFIRLASGSTFLEISKKLVEDTKIIVPNLEEQKKIASILALIDEKIYRYENKKEKLEELKNGLMQSLMTGKIRVI
ncbi:restriction endonuclease subunit S [Clostridium perfringens]